MTTGAKNSLKKRYRIKWVKEDGFGREAPISVRSMVIETPAQYVFNQLIDMLNYQPK